MHLDDISLPQVIIFSNYNASSRKIFSRWSVQLFNESPLFGTDNIFIGSHVSYTIIDWLTHNNTRDKITLRFISFFQPFLSFMSFVLPFFAVHIVVRIAIFLSFMSFIMPFFAVRCCLYYRFLLFFTRLFILFFIIF